MLIQLVQMWVSSHNIHSLSLLCAGLMREPGLIDQIFLHTSIPSLIEPLREFLDTWTIDEEDDNGSIILIPSLIARRTSTYLRAIQLDIVSNMLLCSSFRTTTYPG